MNGKEDSSSHVVCVHTRVYLRAGFSFVHFLCLKYSLMTYWAWESLPRSLTAVRLHPALRVMGLCLFEDFAEASLVL